MIEKTISVQQKRIFYRVSGEGPVVVLLHGIPANGSLWQSQYSSINGYKFIVPDLPGCGRSELPEKTTIDSMAEVFEAVLNEEKVEQATFIGHSIGGYISLAFADKFSSRLCALGLFHSTAYPDTKERIAIRKNAIEVIRGKGAFSFLETMVPTLFAPAHRQDDYPPLKEIFSKAEKFTAETLITFYEAMMKRPGRSTVLEKLKVPVLFIAGKYDPAVPLNDSLKQCSLPDISYIYILSDSAHMGMLEETKRSNEILKAFLENSA